MQKLILIVALCILIVTADLKRPSYKRRKGATNKRTVEKNDESIPTEPIKKTSKITPSIPTEPIKADSSKINHIAPAYIEWFVGQYQKNLHRLKKADPCVFQPCGPNTHCVRDYAQGSRTCHCEYGYVPNKAIPESCVRPCDLYHCTEYAFCVNKDDGDYECVCESGYFPTVISEEQPCINPCEERPCPQPNTICFPLSANDRKCSCVSGTVPVAGAIEPNGCGPDLCVEHPCTAVGTVCHITSDGLPICICDRGMIPKTGDIKADGCFAGSCDSQTCKKHQFCKFVSPGIPVCICLPGYYLEDGKCVERPCQSPYACGQNSYCVEKPGFEKLCICDTGYFPESDNDHDGCTNPCDSSPCDGVIGAVCSGLSATTHECIVPSGSIIGSVILLGIAPPPSIGGLPETPDSGRTRG